MKLRIFVILAFLSAALLSGCTEEPSPNGAEGETGSNAPGSGEAKVLRVLYATGEAGSEAIINEAQSYEKQTGIRVEVNTFPYTNLQEKVFSELAQQSGYYDLIAIDTPWMPKIIRHLEPLTPYIQKSRSPESIRLDDFIAKVFLDTSVFKQDEPQANPPAMDEIRLEPIVNAGFDIWSLPVQSNVLTVSYRKDLFNDPINKAQFKKQFNRELDIPNTLDEYLDIARFFTRDTNHDGKIDLYGTTLMGKLNEANFVDFKSFLSDYGGRVFDENMRPVINSVEGVKALEAYGSWINRYKVTPPGVLAYTWEEVAVVFGSGQVAMGMNYHDMKLDPRVKGGEVGYFEFPGVRNGGQLVRGPHFGSWGIGISKYSTNKQGAYELAQRLASPEAQKGYLKFNQHVTRKSAYEAAEAFPEDHTREYYRALGESLKVGVGRPRITNYDQVSEAVQIAVNDYLTGKKDAKKALDEGAAQIGALMEQAGY